MHCIEWHSDVLFADTKKATYRHYEGADLAVLFNENVGDFAYFLFGPIINALLVPIRHS